MPYNVKLPIFEGPFDLLLNLISRHKVNIYDVPLAEITEEYLHYLDELRQLDLEIASEFLLVAATLLEIKSAGLLPRPVPVEDDDQILDAFEQRQLLIGRLVEYRKFKNSALALAGRLDAERRFFAARPCLEDRFEQILPDFLAGVDLSAFSELMQQVMNRHQVRLIDSTHIANIRVSVEAKVEELLEKLGASRRLRFRDVTAGNNRAEVVASFLALLELYRNGEARIVQDTAFGDIQIIRTRLH